MKNFLSKIQRQKFVISSFFLVYLADIAFKIYKILSLKIIKLEFETFKNFWSRKSEKRRREEGGNSETLKRILINVRSWKVVCWQILANKGLILGVCLFSEGSPTCSLYIFYHLTLLNVSISLPKQGELKPAGMENAKTLYEKIFLRGIQ